MRFIRIISKFVELSKWFNRKSQHYILGNWLIYETNWSSERWTWRCNKKCYSYLSRYPKAWCKFMWYSRHDIFGA